MSRKYNLFSKSLKKLDIDGMGTCIQYRTFYMATTSQFMSLKIREPIQYDYMIINWD